MEFEKYTDRAKGFLQSAQNLALLRGHQRLTPEHLLKILLEDPEGLCANLIRAAGGDPKAALAAVDGELDRLPRVEGSGAGQVYMSPELARVFEQAEQLAQKAGDNFVAVERLLLALAAAAGTGAAKAIAAARVNPQSLNRAVEDVRKGARLTVPRPRRVTTRSRSIPATSPRPRARASSIRSSVATRRSGGRSRSCRAAPRTTRC
jgi:ATP-dependent Clp protease ATP-binding subunit ClpB